MLGAQWIRASVALLAAGLIASVLHFVSINIATQSISDGAPFDPFWFSLRPTLIYGLPLGAAAAIAIEFLRLRRIDVQIAVGLAVTCLTAHLAMRGEPMTSYAFTGGALTVLGLLASGGAASVTYWLIAGRKAGWRGDEVERDYEIVKHAFRRASNQRAETRPCRTCLAIWGAASVSAFAFVAWTMLEGIGLRQALVSNAEREARTALKTSGHAWARFRIRDNRGVLDGKAPDELKKRIAYDGLREALYAVTGLPGIVSNIQNSAAAQISLASFEQKLADVKDRERQASETIERARRAAFAARAALIDAQQSANPPSASSDATEVKADHAAAQPVNKTASVNELDVPSKDTGSKKSETDVLSVAAVSDVAPSAEQVGAQANTTGQPGGRERCTDQDVALLESNSIYFQPQSFEILHQFHRQFDQMAKSIRACPRHPILLTGQSDTNADSLFNPALALQRAESVRYALIARGVSATRIATRAPPYGFLGSTEEATDDRRSFRTTHFKVLEGNELIRDATQGPDERASNCETDLAQIMSRSTILFAIASSRISDESSSLITKLASAIQTCGSVMVTVEGHTDKVGSHFRNQKLSVARANTVRNALIRSGADPTRVVSRGFASTRPVAREDTAEAYAMNRRIEFKVTGKFTSTNIGGP